MFLKSIILFLCFQVCFTQETSLSYSYSNDITESNNNHYNSVMHLFSLNKEYRYIRMKQIMDDYNSFSPYIVPSETPSSFPTELPTVTMVPTELPSILPSNVPTERPSFRSSPIPTQLPSKLIFKVPTFQPTSLPNYIFEPYNISI